MVPGHHPQVVVGCSSREVKCQCSSCLQPHREPPAPWDTPTPRATGHRDLLQRPQMSIFKQCCACAVSRRTESTRRCRRCYEGCPRHRHGGMDWTRFGVTLSLATPAQGLGGMAGAARAAANKKELARAELPWLRARPSWCQGVSSTSQVGSGCSEQLKNWQVAVIFSGKVVKRSV